MGTIYKAEDLDLKRIVALKFLKLRDLESDKDRLRFLHEAQAAASLDHPNIATVYEIKDSPEAAFIAMAYVEGESLQQRLEKGPLEFGDAIKHAIQIAEGLNAAHDKGIVHRDVKSSNVMLTADNQVKITDFGLALQKGRTRVTRADSMVLGTLLYMSPEQAGGGNVDRRTDVWSLGVILYEMLTGQLPFTADHEQAVVYNIINLDPVPPTALRTGIPIEIDRIIAKALAKDPGRRYQHADEMAADLRHLKVLITESSTGEIASIRPRRRWYRSPISWGAAAMALAISLTIYFYPSKTIPFSGRSVC